MPTTPAGHAPAAQRQNLVKVTGIEGLWATKQGGETSAEVGEVWDGGATDPDKLAGPASTGNVTLSRPYKPTRDAALEHSLPRQVGALRTTITVQPTSGDLVAQGTPTVYANALLVKVTPHEADAGSSDTGTIELEFAVGRPA